MQNRHKDGKSLETLLVHFENKNYDIDVDKLSYIISRLENSQAVKIKNEKEAFKLMKKFKLYDSIFLEGISKN